MLRVVARYDDGFQHSCLAPFESDLIPTGQRFRTSEPETWPRGVREIAQWYADSEERQDHGSPSPIKSFIFYGEPTVDTDEWRTHRDQVTRLYLLWYS